jgi:hypothetical protein
MYSPIDARLAASAVQLVHEEGEALERSIPYRLVYSSYPAAIATRSFRRIDKEIRDFLRLVEAGKTKSQIREAKIRLVSNSGKEQPD